MRKEESTMPDRAEKFANKNEIWRMFVEIGDLHKLVRILHKRAKAMNKTASRLMDKSKEIHLKVMDGNVSLENSEKAYKIASNMLKRVDSLIEESGKNLAEAKACINKASEIYEMIKVSMPDID